MGWLGRGRARPQLGMLLADPAQHSGRRRTDEPGDLPDADIVEIHVDGPGLDLGAEARRLVGHVASAVSALIALRPVLAAAPAQIAALTPRTDHANPLGKSPLNRRRIHSRSAVNTAPLRGGIEGGGRATHSAPAATPTRLPPPWPLPWPFPLKSLHRSDLPPAGRSKAPQGGGAIAPHVQCSGSIVSSPDPFSHGSAVAG